MSNPGRTPASGLALMALVTVWSLLLAGGFLVTVATAWDRFSATRALVSLLLGGFLLLVGGRTGYELVRRLRTGRGS